MRGFKVTSLSKLTLFHTQSRKREETVYIFGSQKNRKISYAIQFSLPIH